MTSLPIEAAPYATEEARWQAVRARDAAAAAHFVYAVRTTRIYCLPGSPARLPRRENVEFFDTPALAEAAGYRPSQRDGHAEAAAAMIERACRLIESLDQAPSLADLAARLGVSQFHLHRLFKAATGLTPKNYAAAHRARRLREGLGQAGTSVTGALYDAGFNSNSRFYATAAQRLGMQPRDYQSGGVNAAIRFAVAQCCLGAILVAQSERGICAILLGDDPDLLVRDLQDQFDRAELIGGDADFEQLVARVVGFVEAPALGLDLPLDVRGTAFQERVWQALCKVPAGATVSYAELAERIGAPGSARAVARACAANTLAVAIPCHRVIRRDGGLSGYRWGVARKQALLQREAED